MKIQRGSLVELEYRISDEEGQVHDSSEEGGSLTYTHGMEELPPGLEEALDGLEVGAEVDVTLPAGEAFGDFNPDGIVTVPRAEFPEEVELAVGESIEVRIEDDDGEEDDLEMRIVEISPDGVVLDANHPLASKAARFEVKVLGVSPGE